MLQNPVTRSEICHFHSKIIVVFEFNVLFAMKKFFYEIMHPSFKTRFYRHSHLIHIPLIIWFFVVFSKISHLKTRRISYELQTTNYARLKFRKNFRYPNQSTVTSNRHISVSAVAIEPIFRWIWRFWNVFRLHKYLEDKRSIKRETRNAFKYVDFWDH